MHSVCRAALKDESFRDALGQDAARALEPFDLSHRERSALMTGDVGWLYEQGAHEYALMWLGRAQVLGLTVPEYMRRITGVAAHFIY